MKRVLALDPGFGAAGLVVFEWDVQPHLLEVSHYKTPEELETAYKRTSERVQAGLLNPTPRSGWQAIYCAAIRPAQDKKKTSLRRSLADAEQVAQLVRGVREVILTYEPKAIVAELADAGAPRYSVCRAISLATGWLVALAEALALPIEYYTPREVKIAGAGSSTASKSEMMRAMVERHPLLAQVRLKADLEHIADAAGAFEAARHGQLLRLLQGAA